EEAAAPIDLPERVRAQIGTWHPGRWAIDDPERARHEAAADLELARALLDDPESLAWTLEWSTSEEAHRAHALWVALGRADAGGGLHERLADAVEGGFPALGLGAYLLGWAETDGVETVEDWLRGPRLARASSLAPAALWFLVAQAPARARLDHIRELIERGAIVPRALELLAFRGWAQQL